MKIAERLALTKMMTIMTESIHLPYTFFPALARISLPDVRGADFASGALRCRAIPSYVHKGTEQRILG